MTTFRKLSDAEAEILLRKGTEPPFSGEYTDFDQEGIYSCRQCRAPLYESSAKFKSSCGWPSFDQEILGMVSRVPDADGRRTEIICTHCSGHLGHVFEGEQFTAKNTRHCVNSLSMQFIPMEELDQRIQMAVFASGCFWGTEYWFAQAQGVIATTVGYTGGTIAYPSYQTVCRGQTGHVEAVRVFFDPRQTSYERLVRLFFETHDPSQHNGQGPDIGSQYLSRLYVLNATQQATAEQVIARLAEQGVAVATQIKPFEVFYPEQDPYHQNYYAKKGTLPYCHIYEKKFDD